MRRGRVVAATLVLAALAVLGTGAVVAGRYGLKRIRAHIRISRAEVAEAEAVRDAVLPLFDDGDPEEALRRVAEAVPIARVVDLRVVRWGEMGQGMGILSFARSSGHEILFRGPWDERAEVEEAVVQQVASNALFANGLRRGAAERLAAGPLAPIAATVTARRTSSAVVIRPAAVGDRVLVYEYRDGERGVTVRLLRKP